MVVAEALPPSRQTVGAVGVVGGIAGMEEVVAPIPLLRRMEVVAVVLAVNTIPVLVEAVVEAPFERMTYAEAIKALEASGERFEFPVSWGVDLQAGRIALNPIQGTVVLRDVELASKEQGRILSVEVAVGDTVSEGALIARMEVAGAGAADDADGPAETSEAARAESEPSTDDGADAQRPESGAAGAAAVGTSAVRSLLPAHRFRGPATGRAG